MVAHETCYLDAFGIRSDDQRLGSPEFPCSREGKLPPLSRIEE